VAKKRLEGVSGVLGGLISPGAEEPIRPAKPDVTAKDAGQVRADRPAPSQTSHRVQARRGRPPDSKDGPSPRREKVTLRIDAALIAQYRESSWVQRRQLCELVEEALRAYRPNGHPQAK